MADESPATTEHEHDVDPRKVLDDAYYADLRAGVRFYGGIDPCARALDVSRAALQGALGRTPQRRGTILGLRQALDRIRPELRARAASRATEEANAWSRDRGSR